MMDCTLNCEPEPALSYLSSFGKVFYHNRRIPKTAGVIYMPVSNYFISVKKLIKLVHGGGCNTILHYVVPNLSRDRKLPQQCWEAGEQSSACSYWQTLREHKCQKCAEHQEVLLSTHGDWQWCMTSFAHLRQPSPARRAMQKGILKLKLKWFLHNYRTENNLVTFYSWD